MSASTTTSTVSNNTLPDLLTAQLILKIGKPFTDCRIVYGNPEVFTFAVEEGYPVFKAKIMQKLQTHHSAEVSWDSEDFPIIIKPSTNARQKNYEIVKSAYGEFQAQLLKIWKTAARRKDGQNDFCFEIFIYVAKKEGAGTDVVKIDQSHHHITDSPTVPNSNLINNDMALIGSGQMSSSNALNILDPRHQMQKYQQLQFQQNIAMASTNNSNGKRKLHELSPSINTHSAVENSTGSGDWVTIRTRINGSIVPMEFHIQDLRNAIDLSQVHI